MIRLKHQGEKNATRPSNTCSKPNLCGDIRNPWTSKLCSKINYRCEEHCDSSCYTRIPSESILSVDSISRNTCIYSRISGGSNRSNNRDRHGISSNILTAEFTNTPPWVKNGESKERYLCGIKEGLQGFIDTVKQNTEVIKPLDTNNSLKAFKDGMLLIHWISIEKEKRSLQTVISQAKLLFKQEKVNNGRRNSNNLLV